MKRNSQGDLPDTIQKLRLSWLDLLDSSLAETKFEAKIFTSLIDSYTSRHRSYHNLNHVYDILNWIELVKDFAENTDILRFAAWFHDCIYDPQSLDNEAKSAVEAERALEALNIDREIIKKIEQIILSTKNHQPSIASIDNLLFLDLDLAILGTNPARYREYAKAIRQEYNHVSDRYYQTGRKKVLTQFLNRERIYYTDYFYHRLETAARKNLQAEINYLNRIN